MTEASVTTGRATATRLPSGHIKVLVRSEEGNVAQEMIVTRAEGCDICSSLSMLNLILMQG